MRRMRRVFSKLRNRIKKCHRKQFIAASKERNASLLAFHPSDDASKVQYRPDLNRDDGQVKRVSIIPRGRHEEPLCWIRLPALQQILIRRKSGFDRVSGGDIILLVRIIRDIPCGIYARM